MSLHELLWGIAHFDEARGGSESPKNVMREREREREREGYNEVVC